VKLAADFVKRRRISESKKTEALKFLLKTSNYKSCVLLSYLGGRKNISVSLVVLFHERSSFTYNFFSTLYAQC